MTILLSRVFSSPPVRGPSGGTMSGIPGTQEFLPAVADDARQRVQRNTLAFEHKLRGMFDEDYVEKNYMDELCFINKPSHRFASLLKWYALGDNCPPAPPPPPPSPVSPEVSSRHSSAQKIVNSAPPRYIPQRPRAQRPERLEQTPSQRALNMPRMSEVVPHPIPSTVLGDTQQDESFYLILDPIPVRGRAPQLVIQRKIECTPTPPKIPNFWSVSSAVPRYALPTVNSMLRRRRY